MVPRLRPEPLVVGLSLVVLGALWTLANLGRLDMLSTVRTWWPLVLMVWGALELYDATVYRARAQAGSDAETAPDTEADSEG